jgi:hypothetical protein
MMGRVLHTVYGLFGVIVMIIMIGVQAATSAHAAEGDALPPIRGAVQNQDLRRVDQAIVQVRDQEGTVVAQGVTNQAGEFSVIVPQEGAYSVSAIHETYRSEYVVVKIVSYEESRVWI